MLPHYKAGTLRFLAQSSATRSGQPVACCTSSGEVNGWYEARYAACVIASKRKTPSVVMTAAEKLPERLANAFEEKFGIRPLEGYGCTECSPAVAVNTHDFRSAGFRHDSIPSCAEAHQRSMADSREAREMRHSRRK